MKLVTFTAGGGAPRVGALSEDETRVFDLAAADNQPCFETMLALIEAGDPAVARAREIVAADGGEAVYSFADVELLTPVPQPPQIRDFLCFEKHLINSFEMLRKKKAQAEPDPEEALKRFEKEGADMIFGYSIFNDISARDTQAHEMPAGFGPGKGKDFDTGNIIGPCIVTADAFDPYDAELIVRINGEERSRGNSGEMYHKFEDCIAHTSRAETVFPGEFFASGTVGWGCGLEHDKYLEDGDVIELEVTGIGVLKNKVVKQG